MANISSIKVGTTTYSITPSAHAATSTTYGGATASNYGHVKLSDSYTTSAGTASSSIGASSKAVYDAYNTLNSNKCKTYQGTIPGFGGSAGPGSLTISGVTRGIFVGYSTSSNTIIWSILSGVGALVIYLKGGQVASASLSGTTLKFSNGYGAMNLLGIYV